MPQVCFNGSEPPLPASPGETLLSCIRRSGLSVESTCDGRGVCGRCRVIARGELSPPDDVEKKHLAGLADDLRLACRAKVLGNVFVTLNETWTELRSALGPRYRDVGLDSFVKRVALPAKVRSPHPYAETLPYRVTDPRVFNKIAEWDADNNEASGVTASGKLLDIRFDRKALLGAAIDVGTTSLALYLFDLESGELLGAGSALNPQTAYGGDVITRIGYCRKNLDGLSVLRSVLIEKLESMLDEALGWDRSRDQVYLVVAAGNTTMLHILAGVDPLPLSLAPFRPGFLKTLVVEGERFGFSMAPGGRLVLLPGAAAYVGADIVGGLTAVDYRSCPACTLFIDIGTNGEIVLIDGPDRLLATSCALGPALEGMNISCGCRAVPGAIDSIEPGEDLSPVFTTINGLPPIGICGSGLVDLVAALVSSGVITSSGAFDHGAAPAGRLKEDRYHLTDDVYLSQRDIRQVQMAKSAVLSGILTLLGEAGRSVADLERIIVAGSFGYHLKPEKLKCIGLLPPEYTGQIVSVGNSSLSGAALAVLNHNILEDMEHLASGIQVLDLGSRPDFSKRFLSHLGFEAHEKI